MKSDILSGKKHIHFIGVGGSGMYPLAQILRSKGYYVTGSDNNETETLKAVRDAGVIVYPLGQRAENIEGADLIVYTSAVMETNPELAAARNSGVQLLERAELLGIITGDYPNAVCVSGTHGKTTVTSMITQILVESGKDITAYIGGKLPIIHGSGRVGSDGTMVCESCEFRDHFLKLFPDIAVILNIDEDHLDYFKNLDNIIASFRRFAQNASKAVIVCGDDENSMKAVQGLDKDIVTFGKGADNLWRPENIRYISGMKTEFDIMRGDELFVHAELNIPGRHNVLNAVAAAAAAFMSGGAPEDIAEGLADFRGAGRRFEKYGEEKGITVVDDYAHHPAEIAACLTAAKELDFKRVWAVFQPFTFSRTALLMEDFAKALQIADVRVITAIMGGRENNDYDVHTSQLAAITPDAVFFEEEDHDRNFELVTDYVAQNAEAGDLVITLGCGDVNKAARLLLKKLSERSI
ncbi:MAG: UDP-N-acetylmuramate--L-alanine ligase [Oscillospiraceae bacterium]